MKRNQFLPFGDARILKAISSSRAVGWYFPLYSYY